MTLSAKKVETIGSAWAGGHGIMLIKIGDFLSSYEACCREYALIKALGLEKLSNKINSCSYGALQDWTEQRIINYGNMMLFYALEKSFRDEPNVILFNDLFRRK